MASGTIEAGTASQAPHSSALTYAAIGVIACALADMTHEVLGHVTVAWMMGVRITVLATVGMQAIEASRLVSAAGTAADLVYGALALVLFSRMGRRTNWALFLWLFAAFNLFNSAYLIFSAVAQSGDWAVVIRGLHPAWAWRCLLGIVGIVLYLASVRWLAHSMGRLVQQNELSLSELRRLVFSAYLSGGAILTLASVFNPFSPKLILISGIGASFGLFPGLLFIPRRVETRIARASQFSVLETSSPPTSFSALWVGAAIVVGLVFVAVFGPGIHFRD